MATTIPAPLIGKVAIITGASRGIGAAIAIELAHKGAAAIAITYVDNLAAAEDTLSKIKAASPHATCVAIKADLLSPTFGEDIVKATLSDLKTSHLDIIVNNAAISDMRYQEPFEEMSYEGFERMMRGNGWGSIQLIRAALPHIRPGGRIINISSTSSKRPNLDPVMAYGMSKAALDSITRSLAVKYAAEKKITINSVSPGPTETDLLAQTLKGDEKLAANVAQGSTAEKRTGRPEDVAGIVSFLASDEARWINGNHVPASGGRAGIMDMSHSGCIEMRRAVKRTQDGLSEKKTLPAVDFLSSLLPQAKALVSTSDVFEYRLMKSHCQVQGRLNDNPNVSVPKLGQLARFLAKPDDTEGDASTGALPDHYQEYAKGHFHILGHGSAVTGFPRPAGRRHLAVTLGYAAKIYVSEGDLDRHYHAASSEQKGYYYKWHRGIHMLCGEEGIDHYKHRPAFEDLMANIWYFDLDYKSAIPGPETLVEARSRGISAIEWSRAETGQHPLIMMVAEVTTLADSADRKAALFYKFKVKAEVKEEMRQGYQKTLAAEVENDAKKDVRDVIKKKLRREVLQETKEKLIQELRAE
ncbi:MAG: hypothetical protein ASARMPREDX12_006254 [Alectoria sarmentosa]|nr:MAG: hypothetical protein ASARMPREDX12_006254 [Alectoria sarmentosa]